MSLNSDCNYKLKSSIDSSRKNTIGYCSAQICLTLLEKGTSKESDLLKEINLGVSADTWTEYQILIAKRQAETLTQEDQQQLIGISDRSSINLEIERHRCDRSQALEIESKFE